MKKTQSRRLTDQHKQSKGVIGIFGEEAKFHDAEVSKVASLVLNALEKRFSATGIPTQEEYIKEGNQ